MTANRAEQKGGDITEGITTAEQRAALEKAGWILDHSGTHRGEWWYKDSWWVIHVSDTGSGSICTVTNGRGVGLATCAEATAILGIASPGYVMVPVEVAEAALPLVQAVLEKMSKPAVTVNDCAADEARSRRIQTWTNLAAALKR